MLFLLALLTGLLTGLPGWAGGIAQVSVEERGISLTFGDRWSAIGAVVIPGGAGTRVLFDPETATLVAAEPVGSAPATLTLALATGIDPSVPASPPRASSAVVTIPTRVRSLPLPPVAGPEGRPLVVIDAGHGGRDPGATSTDGTLREKELTLAAALAIRDKLLASGRVRVAMTRDDDRFLVLQERYGIARRLGADLFISVHCDSAGNPLATGATAYTLSEVASDKEAARLAARENKADIIAGIDLGQSDAGLSSILIDLTQRETMAASAGFARLLEREAQPLIRTRPRFHRMASLIVLKAPDLPSILLEMGYMSNDSDIAFLASREGRDRIAESVRRAVEVHFARRLLEREQIASRGGNAAS